MYDFDFDLELGPPDSKRFWGSAYVSVLSEGDDGVTDYRIYIGTPVSLVRNFSEVQDHIKAFTDNSPNCVFGRGLMLLDEYNIDVIENAIRQEVDNLDFYAFDVS